MRQLSSFLFSLFTLVSLKGALASLDAFPKINLEYAVHAATYTNSSPSGLEVATYANIRYAQPPIGNLRFRNAKTPPPHHDGILNGREYPVTDCVSSVPAMVPFPPLNGTHWGQEDCLFLNVLVPEGVKEGDKVPVLHWLHGGAFTFGSKDNKGAFPAGEKDMTYTSPPYMGLFNQINSHDEKFILVASNYRLGVYGWVSSPFEKDLDSNIGLHDSRTSLEWTKKYISRFGGDPDRITAMGESAGATLVTLLLTGDGGAGELPFSQAIISSPTLMPRRNVTARRQSLYDYVLHQANCSSPACLRNLSPASLANVNNHIISDVPTESGGGSFGPGIGLSPVVDGAYIPDTATILFSQGRFHKSVRGVMVANMENEGMGIGSDANMPAAFPNLARKVFTTADNKTLGHIQSLFPYPPSTPQKLGWDWLTSVAYACLAKGTAEAYGERAFRYVMTIPPATHGQDLSYLFYGTEKSPAVANATIARTLEHYVLNFLHHGGRDHGALPGRPGLPDWKSYGKGANTMNISEATFEMVPDPWQVNGVCAELLKVVEDPKNGA
ncbi:hypothetical protein EYZ11_005668 [Aspergillus tanneri]|uniref:Carboxylesterase type B domain-containing protein n=1 Tax=Aspergillus tanneri TaxID=1220188 RepID=A0A4S3JJS4_9EURO|nr:uncharacterized protein ATNIH1004_003861 [Aspergillus tanneri]KAA8647978.1 hypothetical protein ATNIH1004_003861 [Aspergillus tanneri]THC94867.1 hypothetical protein EYZ11_005668 [Aspergillus tanneri]